MLLFHSKNKKLTCHLKNLFLILRCVQDQYTAIKMDLKYTLFFQWFCKHALIKTMNFILMPLTKLWGKIDSYRAT